MDDYITDFLIASIMSNIRLGENFGVAERYKLKTLLQEYELRRSGLEFDPRDAIKQGVFKGVDAVLTGNIYVSSPTYSQDGNARVEHRGSAQFLIRLIDVAKTDIIANAAESIPYSPLVAQWIEKKSVRR